MNEQRAIFNMLLFMGIWTDGKVGAANVHDVNEAMDKTFAWQAADAT